jgi:hypothetical protein
LNTNIESWNLGKFKLRIVLEGATANLLVTGYNIEKRVHGELRNIDEISLERIILALGARNYTLKHQCKILRVF